MALAQVRKTASDLWALTRAGLRQCWPSQRRWQIVLVLIVLIGSALRVAHINEPPRFDEAGNALYYSGRTIFHAIGSSAGNENHALNSTLMWFSLRIFGWNNVGLRLPVLVSGVLLIVAAFGVIRWLTREDWTAAIAAALMAVSPWLVYQSVNSRGYSHQALLLIVMIGALLRGTRTGRSIPALGIVAGAAGALGAFAARSMLVFVIGAALMWLILLRFSPAATGHANGDAAGSAPATTPRQRLRLLGWWIVSSIVVAAVCFAVPTIKNGKAGLLGAGPTSLSKPGADRVEMGMRTARSTVHAMQGAFDHHGVVWPWILLAAAAVGVVIRWRRALPMVLATVFTLLTAFGISATIQHDFPYRVMFPIVAWILPLTALGLGAVVARAPAARRSAIAIGVTAVVLIGWPATWLPQDNVRRIEDSGTMYGPDTFAHYLAGRKDLDQHMILVPELWDVAIAYEWRAIGVPLDNLATLSMGLEGNPERHTRYSAALLFVPDRRDPRQELDDTLRRSRRAIWYPRLLLDQMEKSRIDSPPGDLYRIPLAPADAGAASSN